MTDSKEVGADEFRLLSSWSTGMTDLKLAICIHRASTAGHKDLVEYMRGYTLFYGYRMKKFAYGIDIVQADTIDDGLKQHGADYDHILFMAAGVRIYSSEGVINDIAAEIRSKPDYLAMAHMLDWTKQNRWWELHEQFVLINTKIWREIGAPEFGGFVAGSKKELPVLVRSVENFHDDYTPLWVKDTGEKKDQEFACPGHNLLDVGCRFGLQIYAWQPEIRNKRTYYYPENEPEIFWDAIQTKQIEKVNYSRLLDDQKRFVGEIITGVQDQVWVLNSESLYLSNYGERFKTIALPASGFKFLDVYHSKVLSSSGNIVVYDYSDRALNWIKHIHNSKAINIKEMIETFVDWEYLKWSGLNNKPILIDNNLNLSFIEEFDKTLEYFGGEVQFWKYIEQFRNADIKFIKADIVKKPSELIQHFNGRTLFHISNIFSTDWLIAFYGLSKTKQLFNKLIGSTLDLGNIKVAGSAPSEDYHLW